MSNRRTVRGAARAFVGRILVSATIAGGSLATVGANAFCRTTACPLPPDFDPSVEGSCSPANFAQYCQSLDPPAKALPLWWRNACVSYDVQQNATMTLPYATVATIVDAAFAKWASVTCEGDERVSIAATNLGPVACDKVEYTPDQGNQHVIVFRDPWPHQNDVLNTLGLTTVTFDPETGEIYDADTEINAGVALSVDGSGTYDFESIITHEAGHFLGMAHSITTDATMYAHYLPGSTTMRTLQMDDGEGICAIYPPGGLRGVDPSVSPGGVIPEDSCDPTPRHGFSPQCAPDAAGCRVAAPGTAGAPIPTGALATLVLVVGVATRRRNPQPSTRPVCRPLSRCVRAREGV